MTDADDKIPPEDVPALQVPDKYVLKAGEPDPTKVPDTPLPEQAKIDNPDADAALAFLEAGAPLQSGTPDNPAAELTKLRKSKR